MKKNIIITLSILMVLVGSGFLLIKPQSDDRVDGIDISHHNVVSDWNKVNAGFIYAKATEGRSHRDKKFVRFRKNAMKRSIPFGAYHFLSTDVSAKQQFQNFRNVVPKGSTTLIPMLDIEGKLPISNDSLKLLVGGWIKECHDYYGVYPILYLSPFFLYYRLIGTPNLGECKLWSGGVGWGFKPLPFVSRTIIQFKIDKVEGFVGGVDCNQLNGSIDELKIRNNQNK